MTPRVIGLYSPAPQSGKSTLARYLSALDYTCVPFARVLKRMSALLLQELGYSGDDARHLVYQDKEQKLPEIGVTPRHILQTLGTEWGRQCIHPNLWLFCWEAQVKRLLAEGHNVVVDDCRFPNEAALIRQYGGQMWLITRPGVERPTHHASEGGLSDIHFDHHLENNGAVLDLYLTAESLLQPDAP